MGLFNDSFGKGKSHREWLSWIAEGYVSSQSKEELSGMPDFWEVAPSGGEFATSEEKEYYFSEGLKETMQFIQESHTTFLGPRSGADVTEPSLKEEILTMSGEMGYCFRLSEVMLRKLWWHPGYCLTIGMENIGVAPFYENWPLLVCIYHEAGERVYEQKEDIKVSTLLPGKHTLNILLRDLELPAGQYTIAVGLIDPMTGLPGVAFANESNTKEDFMYRIMEFTKKK